MGNVGVEHSEEACLKQCAIHGIRVGHRSSERCVIGVFADSQHEGLPRSNRQPREPRNSDDAVADSRQNYYEYGTDILENLLTVNGLSIYH